MLIFGRKDDEISRIKEVLVLKVYFLKLHICEYLRTKYQGSSINLTRRTAKMPSQTRFKQYETNFFELIQIQLKCSKNYFNFFTT